MRVLRVTGVDRSHIIKMKLGVYGDLGNASRGNNSRFAVILLTFESLSISASTLLYHTCIQEAMKLFYHRNMTVQWAHAKVVISQ